MKRGMYMFGLLALFGIVFAAAATVNVNGGTIQHGSDNKLTCTENVNVDGWGLETNTNKVHHVRLNYNPKCAGNTMFIVVTHDGTPIADAKVAPLDNSGSTGNVKLTELGFNKTTASPQDADIITDIEIWIEGPGGVPNNP